MFFERIRTSVGEPVASEKSMIIHADQNRLGVLTLVSDGGRLPMFSFQSIWCPEAAEACKA